VVTEVSDRLLWILGIVRDDIVGRQATELARLRGVNGEPIPLEERPIWQVLSGRSEFVEVGTSFDVAVETPAGPMPVIIRAAPVRDRSGAISAAVAVVEGIGALSNHDLLTRLPNHAIFVDRVVRAARQSAAEGLSYGVVAVALDRFERLRASLSPAAVDDIVRDLGGRLRAMIDQCLELDEATRLVEDALATHGVEGWTVGPLLPDHPPGACTGFLPRPADRHVALVPTDASSSG